jgi:hypothetical protein
VENAGNHLKKCTLAGTVFADDTERLASLNFEGDIPQCPEIAVK